MAYSSSSKTRSYDLSHGDTRRSVTMTQAADPASTLWRAHGSDGHDASIHLTSQYIRLLSPIHSLLSVSMSYSLLQGRPLNPEKSPPNIPETGRGGGRDIALFVTIFAVVLHCQKIEQKAPCCLQISKVTKSAVSLPPPLAEFRVRQQCDSMAVRHIVHALILGSTRNS